MDERQTSNIEPQNKDQIPNGENPISNLKFLNNNQIPKGKPQKIFDIRERLLIFSKRILNICKLLPRIPEYDGIRKQLASAGTSIGANFEEADGAITKKDFINKVAIARKEAKETKYWLQIINSIYFDNTRLSEDIRESEELISILSAIIRKCGINTRL